MWKIAWMYVYRCKTMCSGGNITVACTVGYCACNDRKVHKLLKTTYFFSQNNQLRHGEMVEKVKLLPLAGNVIGPLLEARFHEFWHFHDFICYIFTKAFFPFFTTDVYNSTIFSGLIAVKVECHISKKDASRIANCQVAVCKTDHTIKYLENN